MNQIKKEPLIGAHTSASGGSFNALIEGHNIGANTIQIFTSNQKTWVGRKISEQEVEEWKAVRKKFQITTVISHSGYLINLGSPNHDLLNKSLQAFKEELERCHLLEINYLNFHPGSYTTGNRQECLEMIVESLLEMSKLINKGETKLLIETSAGQGTSVCYQFEEIGYIIKQINEKIPIGVCIDTCHIFVAGYDIRTKAGWVETLKEFDKHIGLKYLCAMHLNDAKYTLGSRKDRHESLGCGEIGITSFKIAMTHPDLKNLPKYLETPNTEKWIDEIELLKSFYVKGDSKV